MRTFSFLCSLFLAWSAPASAATITVGKGQGFDFTTLTQAVVASSPFDTVVISDGVYDTTSGEIFPISIDKNISIVGSSSAEVIINATGSGQGVLDIKDPQIFAISGVSIRGGSSENGGGGILWTQGSGQIRDCSFRGNTTTLRGGGLFLNSTSSVTVEGCLFEDNHAPGIVRLRPGGGSINNGEGGGISTALFSGGFVSIKRCVFRGNSASDEASALRIHGFGGNTIVEDSVFEDNWYGVPELSSRGFGTAFVNDNNQATFRRCYFMNNNNMVLPFRHGLAIPYSYALYQETGSPSSSLTVEICEIVNNRGMGGIHMGRGQLIESIIRDNDGNGVDALDSQIADCSIQGNGLTGVFLRSETMATSLSECEVSFNGLGKSTHDLRTKVGGVSLFGNQFEICDSSIIGNRGFTDAGGVSAFADHLLMKNCVVAGNRSSGEFRPTGGMTVPGGSREGNIDLINCSFTGNTRNASPSYENRSADGIQIDAPANVSISNSIIWNGTTAIRWRDDVDIELTYCNLSQFVPGEGNIFEDPEFVHPWDGLSGDYRLPCHSPCVDAGTSEGAPEFDIEGTYRPRGAGVDMGAYENCHFDLNGDGVEDVKDLVSFPSVWYGPVNETNFGFDINRSGVSRNRIDRFDLDELLKILSDS